MGSGRTRFDFSGQTVVVTGGSRGIGRQICEAFAEAGARVETCSRRLVDEPYKSSAIRATAVDVRDPEATRAWLEACARARGGFDVLVNNAGGAPSVDSADASPKLVQKILELNLLAPLVLSQQAHAHLSARPGGGSIVNIVSISSVRPTPKGVAYGAAKAGLMSATTSLAVEWGPAVRVNCIVAGLVATELTGDHFGEGETQREIQRAIPAGRFARAEEIAQACLYLAARDSSYVSGAALEVHGGGEWPPTVPHPAA